MKWASGLIGWINENVGENIAATIYNIDEK